jgi:aminopeptidase N
MAGRLLACFILICVASGASSRLGAQARDAADVVVEAARSFLPTDGYQRRTAVDILHYDIGINLPSNGRSIRGEVGILFEVLERESRVLPLDFAKLTIDSVKVDGAPVTFRQQGERLTLDLPPLKRGARAEAVVWYRGEPADGLFLQKNRHGNRAVFSDNWPNRAHHWFPCVDHPSDKATVDFEVEAPASMDVVAPGVRRELVPSGEGRNRSRWSMSAEIPTYTMVIGAADFAIQEAGVVDGTEVTHWTFPEDSAAGAAGFARSGEVLAFFDSLFGPFPYDKLAHIQSSTRFGGMENASAVFYDQNSFAAKPGEGERGASILGEGALTEVLAHETVHQWFGDAVTESDWHHLWLSEGFATYFTNVFFEFHGGPEGGGPVELQRRMREAARKAIAFFKETGKPVVDTREYDYFKLRNPNNYEKGGWVLHMLRRQLGDAAFFSGVRDYYADFRDGTAWTADLQRVMEEASGSDLGWFFEQWVRRPGHPVLTVQHDELEEESGLSVVTVLQVQPGAAFSFPLDLAIRWRGGSRVEHVAVVAREERFTFDTPAPIEDVEIDPAGWLLHQRVE